jgi:hypothetical protein
MSKRADCVDRDTSNVTMYMPSLSASEESVLAPETKVFRSRYLMEWYMEIKEFLDGKWEMREQIPGLLVSGWVQLK